MNLQTAVRPSSAPKTAPGGSSQEHGFPIGTIHNGRQKISANPSKWVDLKSGHSYDEHNAINAHSPTDHSAVKNTHKAVLSKIEKSVHPDDVSKIQGLFHDWIEKKVKAKNLQTASNVDSSATGKMSNTHVVNAGKQFDEADRAKKSLISAIKDSMKKKKGSLQ